MSEGGEDGPQRPWGEWPFALVLAGSATSLGVVAADHFRAGTVAFAGTLLVAMLLRLTLGDRRSGVLAVRSRLVDVLTLGALATGTLVLALAIPPPS